jgi:hypothetical protein
MISYIEESERLEVEGICIAEKTIRYNSSGGLRGWGKGGVEGGQPGEAPALKLEVVERVAGVGGVELTVFFEEGSLTIMFELIEGSVECEGSVERAVGEEEVGAEEAVKG